MNQIGKNTKDLTGQKFGKLLVETPAGIDNRRRALWTCLCECGTRVIRRGDMLQTRDQTCGGPTCRLGIHHEYPKPGDKFGMLTAIGFSHTNKNGGGIYWNFKCDCGTDVKTRWFQVKNKKIDHCGCQSSKRSALKTREIYQQMEQPLNKVLNTYIKNAVDRHLPFELTPDQFFKLILSNCFYCGNSPAASAKARRRKFVTVPDNLLYTGVDRWDNKKGYIVGNVVPCCGSCNYIKRSRSVADFIEWLKTLVDHVNDLELNWEKNKKAVEISLQP